MVVASPILKTAIDSRKKISQSSSTVDNINKFFIRNQKIKRDSFARINFYRRKRAEDTRRQQLEDELEAPVLVKKPKGSQELVQRSSNKGFLSRIIGFLGYLTAGWIMNNLPTWIGIGKEFVARIKKSQEILSGFFTDITNLFTGSIKVLGGLSENLINFDLFDSSNKIKKEVQNLSNTIQNMSDKIEEAYSLLTTPFTEGKYSGQEIPGFGTQQTDEGAYAEPAPYTSDVGPETSGGKVSPQTVYAYLRSKNISHIHAMGILANIEGESGFEIGVQEKGDSQQGIGLFQYTHPSRKQAFLKYVPDYKTNWKGQIDFAIDRDPNTPIYLRKQFASPEAAADDWMIYWENPHSRVYAQRRREHNDFIRSFKPGASQQQSQPGQKSKSGNAIFGETGNVRNAPNWVHGHFQSNVGTVNDVVNDTAPIVRGLLDSGIIPELSRGQKFSKNMSMEEIKKLIRLGLSQHSHSGDGRSVDIFVPKGTKVPFPLYDVRNTGKKGGVTGILPGTGKVWVGHLDPKSKSGGTKPTELPTAQIAAAPQQSQAVPSTLTPERRGQDIIIAQPRNQQQTIVTSSGGQSQQGSLIGDIDMLNNFIKNKLLLDLAYL